MAISLLGLRLFNLLQSVAKLIARNAQQFGGAGLIACAPFHRLAHKRQLELLQAMLEERFGPLSETARQRLNGWPTHRLTELGRALLGAGSLAELGLEDAPGGETRNGA